MSKSKKFGHCNTGDIVNIFRWFYYIYYIHYILFTLYTIYTILYTLYYMHYILYTLHYIHFKGSLKKKINIRVDFSILGQNPPYTPQRMDNVFFSTWFYRCFIVVFQFLDVFFTLKAKKKTQTVDWTRNPPPPNGKIHPYVFCFFLKPSLTANC